MDWLLTITYSHQMQLRMDQKPVTAEEVAKKEQEERAEAMRRQEAAAERARKGSAVLESRATIDAMRGHFEQFPLRQDEVQTALSTPGRASVPALLPPWLKNIDPSRAGVRVHLQYVYEQAAIVLPALAYQCRAMRSVMYLNAILSYMPATVALDQRMTHLLKSHCGQGGDERTRTNCHCRIKTLRLSTHAGRGHARRGRASGCKPTVCSSLFGHTGSRHAPEHAYH